LKIIEAKLTELSEGGLEKTTYAHRLGMPAKNVLGLILEDYLAESLEQHA